MDKASKAIRRNSIKLKNMGSGQTDLGLVISELKEVRAAVKTLMQAQSTAAQDMLRWSMGGENRAIQDACTHLVELNSLWTEIQKDFSDHLKEYRHQFEMVLEGERHVTSARSSLEECEHREARIRKELKRTSKKVTSEEIRQLEMRLAQAVRSRDLAQLELVDRVRENETVKLIRIKESLLKISESYLELAHKCQAVFEAQYEIVVQIPDVNDRDIQDIKYTGTGVAKQAVSRAKDRLHQYCRRPPSLDPPPPYSPPRKSAAQNARDPFCRCHMSCPGCSHHREDRNSSSGNPFVDHRHCCESPNSPSAPPAPVPQVDGRELETHLGDLDYEEEISGAMGATHI